MFELKKSGLLATTFLIFSEMCGGGVLALPYAFSQSGWAFGLSFLILGALASAFTGKILSDCFLNLPHNRYARLEENDKKKNVFSNRARVHDAYEMMSDYEKEFNVEMKDDKYSNIMSDTATSHFNDNIKMITQYSEIAKHAFGKAGVIIVCFCQICTLVGASIVFLILIATNIQVMIPSLFSQFEEDIAKIFWILIVAACCWPLFIFRTTKDIKWTAILGTIGTLGAVITLIVYTIVLMTNNRQNINHQIMNSNNGTNDYNTTMITGNTDIETITINSSISSIVQNTASNNRLNVSMAVENKFLSSVGISDTPKGPKSGGIYDATNGPKLSKTSIKTQSPVNYYDNSTEKCCGLLSKSMKIAESYGIILFSYGGHSLFPTLQRDMNDPKQFTKAMLFAYIAIFAIYILISSLVYAAFEDNVEKDLVRNFAKYPIVFEITTSMISLHLFVTIVLLLNPIMRMLEEFVLKNQSFRNNECVSITKRFGLRSALFLVVIIVAIVFRNMFSEILSLIGATSMSMLTFIMPSLCYLKIFKIKPKGKECIIFALHSLCIIIGIIAALCSTTASIANLQQQS